MKHKQVHLPVAIMVFLIAMGSVWAVPPADNLLIRITTLEDEVTLLEDNFDTIPPHTLPSGAVMAWSGSVYNLPKGWALCDGQNGTPDLRDRFIVGAGSDADVGESGGTTEHEHGSVTHDHSVAAPVHNHSIAPWQGDTEDSGEHRHSAGEATKPGSSPVDDTCLICGRTVSADDHNHGAMSSTSGLHGHYLKIPERTSSDGEGQALTTPALPASDLADHMPRYYQLAFIIKLPQETISVVTDPSTRNPHTRIAELETEVAEIGAALDSFVPYQVPSALIVAWSGSVADLPVGWLLCDGSNGTPDLRDKYILGTFSDEWFGQTDDEAFHTHYMAGHEHEVTIPSHGHSIARWAGFTRTTGGHAHIITSVVDSTSVGSKETGPIASSWVHDHPTDDEAGAHAHELVIPPGLTSQDSGTDWTLINSSDVAPANHLPPFYKLAFIQKAPNTVQALNSAPITTTPDPITRIDMIEDTVSDLSTRLMLTRPFLVPAGAVGLWSGYLDSLPQGWAWCDGTNGTPDLRLRFLLGTADSVGIAGGDDDHEHSVESHAHAVSFPHSHPDNTMEIQTETRRETRHHHALAGSSSPITADSGSGTTKADSLHLHDLRLNDSHEHYVELDDNIVSVDESLQGETEFSSDSTDPYPNLPPYYAMTFIVKLVEDGN